MSEERRQEYQEEGIEVPPERLDPATLRNLVAEFVTREWNDGGSVEQQIAQVLRLLRQGKAKIVFDAISGSCNIVESR